ncbi:gliding motility protein GldL [Aurantibacter aestuarii]|uniref:Gliding motility protein GldL n=1 Tax=Aurantibacter aestuarii TaxID=1266046 RepID=A0A2T1NFQ0_9FLAO|nr:gliding motility protein GldL [Aurantibacter aestuarii]PSG91617.1 gliding motility protein GldL [Aurantibacter aestuarii]
MKVKHILAVLISGFALSIISAVFKILHLQFAQEALILATLLIVIGFILLIIKLFTSKKFKDFLNS